MAEKRKPRILVADDDQDILDLVTFILTYSGYEVVGAVDGSAAIAAIEADPPKMAILDVMMPGMSGIEVLQRVRKSDAHKNLHVILFSVITNESVIAAGLAAGANEFIRKPVNLRELMNIVNTFLARSENE
ncbi:MAG: response regulator [Ilumatobacteraceae bacterium]